MNDTTGRYRTICTTIPNTTNDELTIEDNEASHWKSFGDDDLDQVFDEFSATAAAAGFDPAKLVRRLGRLSLVLRLIEIMRDQSSFDGQPPD